VKHPVKDITHPDWCDLKECGAGYRQGAHKSTPQRINDYPQLVTVSLYAEVDFPHDVLVELRRNGGHLAFFSLKTARELGIVFSGVSAMDPSHLRQPTTNAPEPQLEGAGTK
jgi:hypothetical protein